MIELRPYQKEATDKGMEFFQFGDPKEKPIIVAPTAAGKSIYIGHMANELKDPVLVLQPSKELLEQNYEKFRSYGGYASIYSASMGMRDIGHTTFATIGSIKGIPAQFAHVKNIMIDECHLVPPKAESMFMKFLSALPEVKVIGLTATAFRLKKYSDPFSRETYSQVNILTRERPHFFNRFLHITQIDELYALGFLCPVRYIRMQWDGNELRVNTTGAEFTEQSITHALKVEKINERIPNVVKQSIEKGRKFRVVFVNSVADAMDLAAKVPESACVHAGTSKAEREMILHDFRWGKIKTVFNVNVLTIGFDFPALDTIIIARPTMSLALYMQMIGRGIRKSPGKEDCVVVDMCGNSERFGEIDKMRYERDELGKWVIRDDQRVLSGVRLDKIKKRVTNS